MKPGISPYSKVMRIAIVTYSLKTGGVESVIFNLANSFKQRNHTVEVIETQGRGEWSGYFKSNNLKVRTFSYNQLTIPGLHVLRISRYLRSFDCILINDAPYAQAGIGLLNKAIKVFPVLHLGLPSMIRNALAGTGQWNRIICISPRLKNLLDQKISKDLSVFIPNGIESTEWVKRDFNTTIKIIFIGRIEDSQKGVFLLPKIIWDLKQRGFDFRFVIIGDGPSFPELQRMINDRDIADKVFLSGPLPHEEVIQAMRENHFFIMPSNYEGMPVVLLEAMSSGLVPIVSNLSGHTDILVKEGTTGFFGEPGDAKSFVSAILKAIEDRTALNQISKNASDFIGNHFNLQEITESYLKLFSETQIVKRRNNKVDFSIIPDFPYLPLLLARFIRKVSRVIKISLKK
jgi:glycosyltransferase involved in cell wall biosynthesis